ncbi:DNA glycosylase AlkZ-like family protein [Escherichia coli]
MLKNWAIFGRTPICCRYERALAGKLTATHSAVLSPFDPVVWDRNAQSSFLILATGWKGHTPAPKRQYGYFVLPLLHRGQLVGEWMPKCIARQASLKLSLCGYRRY